MYKYDGQPGEVILHTEGMPINDAVAGLKLLVKFDGVRKEKRWTVGIPGIGFMQGDSPEEAGNLFNMLLTALTRNSIQKIQDYRDTYL